jgi:hypothetical protein
LKEKNYIKKNYFHFDTPVHISKVKNRIIDSNYIANHSFYPLIHYTDQTHRYSTDSTKWIEDGRPYIIKEREIKYAGHFDGFIYRYYAEELNCFYNKYLIKHDLDDVSIAYRNNKSGQSNISFAAEIIRSIYQIEDAYIFVSDFKGYFDTLDHELLLSRLSFLLGYKKLPKDWWNVWRSISKYGYVKKRDIEEYFRPEHELRQMKKKRFIESDKDLRNFMQTKKVFSNKSRLGIPQGTPISAVLANVYAIDLDKKISELIREHNGIYRRYSDDLIIILPKSSKIKEDFFSAIVDKIGSIVRENKLKFWTYVNILDTI